MALPSMSISRFSSLMLIFILANLLAACTGSRFITGNQVEIDAGKYDRDHSIVRLPAIPGLKRNALLALQHPDNGYLTPVQRNEEGEGFFILDEPLGHGQKRTYRLVKPDKKAAGGFKVESRDGDLITSANEKNVLTYHMDTQHPPPGNPDFYRRSGYIDPLYNPAGQALTDGFPLGHMHQHALFFAYTNTTYRDSFTDFWNQHLQKATVAFEKLEKTESGPVFAGFTTRQIHSSNQFGPVLAEEWQVASFQPGDYYITDLRTTQNIIGKYPLRINEYHYGALGIRGSAEWNESDTLRFTNPMQVLTSEGVRDREKANHSRPRWTAVYGKIGGKWAGLAVLDHPDNFRHPTPIRVHPDMPYFSVSPMVLGAYSLDPGQTYRFRYQVVAFEGEPDADLLEKLWRDFAEPVRAKWMTGNKN